jgi:hypothetical protein
MATYVWDNELDTFVDKKTREPMIDPKAKANWSREIATCAPMVVSDTPEYISPATGKLIHGKRERREDLARSGCVPYEPISNRPRGIANERIAKKYGLKVNEAAAHRQRAKRIDPLASVKR